MNLATPSSVQKLQKALHDKAKESPKRRFHALYDKVYRKDVLAFAYACCKPMAERQEWMARAWRTSRSMGGAVVGRTGERTEESNVSTTSGAAGGSPSRMASSGR